MAKPTADTSLPRLRRGPFPRWPRTTDALLGLLVALGTLSVFVPAEDPERWEITPVDDLPLPGYLLLAAPPCRAGSDLAC